MYGMTRTSSRYYSAGADVTYIYYACPHSRASTRRQAANPDHPRNLSIREDYLLAAIRQFFAERIFGPERAALLATQIPATTAEDTAQRQQQATALRQRKRHIDAAENAHAREIESLAHEDDPHAPALTALRSRIIARFTELETERAKINTELDALGKHQASIPDPGLLDRLPTLGDILHQAPRRLQEQLFAAFDLQILYSKEDDQASLYAAITDSTPHTTAAILDDTGTPGTTASPGTAAPGTLVSDSARTPIAPPIDHDHGRQSPVRAARRAGRRTVGR
jgi:hypothetical protein